MKEGDRKEEAKKSMAATQLLNPARRGRPRTMFLDSFLLHGILIIVIGLIAYSNTFHVPFQFDDPTNITDNPSIRNIRSFQNGPALTQPRSFTNFTFALNFLVHGADVVGYHIVNLLIHLINTFLLYGFVLLLFRTPVLRQSALERRAGAIAFFSALLFVSHPVQSQAVTYIVQRLASLAALFYLVSVWAYVKSRLLDEDLRSYKARWGWYAFSLVASVVAMKCKETAFTLPLALVLVEFFFFSGRTRRRIFLLIPFILTMLIIPMAMMGTEKPINEMVGDVSSATRLETDMPRLQYLFTEFTVIVTYLRLLIFPVNQNLDYDYPVYASFFEPQVILSFLFLAALFGIALYLVYRDRRSPSSGRLVAFGIFWFFLALSVESSVIPIADVIFEHRLYLPSVGFFLSSTAALFWGAEKLQARWPAAVAVLASALMLTAVLFTGLAYARNTVWQSEVSLWEDVIKKSPKKARGYNGLGLAYLHKQEYDQAISAFAWAILLDPRYGTALNNLGSAFYFTGLYDRAIEEQERAITLNPNNVVFRDNQGLSYAAKGDYGRAAEDFTKAIALDPSYAKAYHNLGFVYHRQGLYPQAIEQYTKAIARDPAFGTFFSNRGIAYAEIGEYGKAIDDLTRAIFLAPDSVQAYSGRGEVYIRLRRFNEALADLNQAISLDPSNASLYLLRGTAHEYSGHLAQALDDYERACKGNNAKACRAAEKLKY